ncbi:MAG: integrase [Acidobacteria bacterium RIFCSPLOWO2_02_FULL_65_29]|nr:MAG: integrase [Acidobacteria bacterium RIFCSPLOWO2_02_FULL_65_29]
MADDDGSGRRQDRWAHLRFAVVGTLLAAPPKKGELQAALTALAERAWQHPIRREPVRFARSTLERWYYQARHAPVDPVSRLRRRLRRDAGQQPSVGEPLRQAVRAQYDAHPSWSYQLHVDNLRVLVQADASLGPLPSYSTVRRYMQAQALLRQRRRTARDRPGSDRLAACPPPREVRSYEVAYVGGLWHADFHHGSLQVLTASGAWVTPRLLAFLDDRSRLCCHAQWYLAETAETFVHGLCQAIQKRGLARACLTDNGSPMTAAETREGLARLGVVHETTLPYSPYQNAKQEVFWAQVEGRLLAMLEGVAGELRLDLLNEATQAWVELEYHHTRHSETKQTPIARFLAGPEVLRPSPAPGALRAAFTTEQTRAQRRSDGTVTVEGVRFEVPARFAHLPRLSLRYARWDLSAVLLCETRTGAVLATLYPLDKTRNADAVRRPLTPPPGLTPPASAGVAPLLAQLLRQYRATGLPPAYLPKDEPPKE